MVDDDDDERWVLKSRLSGGGTCLVGARQTRTALERGVKGVKRDERSTCAVGRRKKEVGVDCCCQLLWLLGGVCCAAGLQAEVDIVLLLRQVCVCCCFFVDEQR